MPHQVAGTDWLSMLGRRKEGAVGGCSDGEVADVREGDGGGGGDGGSGERRVSGTPVAS